MPNYCSLYTCSLVTPEFVRLAEVLTTSMLETKSFILIELLKLGLTWLVTAVKYHCAMKKKCFIVLMSYFCPDFSFLQKTY